MSPEMPVRTRFSGSFGCGSSQSFFFFGSPGGGVMLYLSALMVLLGAVINARSEQQTREDSTEGRGRWDSAMPEPPIRSARAPLGQRQCPRTKKLIA